MWPIQPENDSGDDDANLSLGRDKRFLRDEVYRVLRRWILEQRLTWDQELVETTLAARLGVSRTPIRESIRQLEADGLVERYASGGVRVRRFSARDIREIYDVLLPLFQLSATLASEKYEPDAGHRFEAILQQAGAASDIPRMQALRDDFHTLILELAGNQWLTRTLVQFREYTGPYRRILLRNQQYRLDTLDEMWQIYEAIARRQTDAAGALMRAHVLAFRDRVLDVMGTEVAAAGASSEAARLG